MGVNGCKDAVMCCWSNLKQKVVKFEVPLSVLRAVVTYFRDNKLNRVSFGWGGGGVLP